MWKRRERKPLIVDIDHMKILHTEAVEQLDLMNTSLKASELATGTMRDNLDSMTENHWHAYLDIVHLITMHDEAFALTIKKQGMPLREEENNEFIERQFIANRTMLLLLLAALIRRHQRLVHLWALRSSPMGDYYKDSMSMEREHIGELLAMIQNMI